MLAKEEQGELAFAIQCAESLLQWIGLTKEKANKFIDGHGAYYLPGEEVVEIPALANGLSEPIFPPINDML